jgi:hypothetical protein
MRLLYNMHLLYALIHWIIVPAMVVVMATVVDSVTHEWLANFSILASVSRSRDWVTFLCYALPTCKKDVKKTRAGTIAS